MEQKQSPESQFKLAQNKNQKYANLWRRIIAFVIDLGVIFIFSYLVFMPLKGAYYSGILGGHIAKYYDLDQESGRSISYFIVNFVIMIFLWLYFILMTYKFNATFGKMIMKIKVFSDKNKNLGVWKLILREVIGKYSYLWVGIIVAVVSFFASLPIGETFNFLVQLFVLIVGYGMILFTERKQALHDKIANTVVVLD